MTTRVARASDSVCQRSTICCSCMASLRIICGHGKWRPVRVVDPRRRCHIRRRRRRTWRQCGQPPRRCGPSFRFGPRRNQIPARSPRRGYARRSTRLIQRCQSCHCEAPRHPSSCGGATCFAQQPVIAVLDHAIELAAALIRAARFNSIIAIGNRPGPSHGRYCRWPHQSAINHRRSAPNQTPLQCVPFPDESAAAPWLPPWGRA